MTGNDKKSEELIDRLRQHHFEFGQGYAQSLFNVTLDCKKAADRIQELEVELQAMRGAANSLKSHYEFALQSLSEQGEERERLFAIIEAAKADIAALLWLNGNCEYCEHSRKVEYSGAVRYECKLGNGTDCRAQWRGCKNEP